ncbi:MAG: hypothetical protein J6I73_03335 [Treponema sp.]|nr:hypothetical protein [Treponema sp.]
MRKLILLVFVSFVFAGAAVSQSSKNLIIYFSMHGNQVENLTDVNSGSSRVMYEGKLTGITEAVAKMIQDEVGGDMVFLEVAQQNKYPRTYKATTDVALKEKNSRTRVPIATHVDVSGYDAVFLGFPTWWSDLPMAYYTWLDEVDLSGKDVYVFCTSGGSGMVNTIAAIQNAAPNARVAKQGFHVYYTRAVNAKHDVAAWLTHVGAK